MQTITTIGLDIAKSVFQVHGVDSAGPYRAIDTAGLRQALRCAPTARITSGGRIHPESCRLIW
jgi:transposase